MGGTGGLRHVAHKRVHLERHQPASRQRLGYLEKHKDYIKRAKDFHTKQDTIKLLHRKAAFKNEDEFAFSMVRYQHDDGRLKKKGKTASADELKLLDTQDARYVGMRELADKKAALRQMERLHFLDADRQNKHTVFVDDDDLAINRGSKSSGGELNTSRGASSKGLPRHSTSGTSSSDAKLTDFDIAAHLNTHPALLHRKANRPRLAQLEGSSFADSTDADSGTKYAYRELFARQERAKTLGKVRATLEVRKSLREKGKKVKVSGGKNGWPATYRWEAQRKR